MSMYYVGMSLQYFDELPFDSANTGDDSRRIGHVYPRCTDECRIHGHSDQCWMPEPKQRPSSRMTPLQTGEGGCAQII